MGGMFGGGSSTPIYIPATQAVQTTTDNSVDANKAVADTKDKIKKQIAAKSSTENNIVTSPLGVNEAVPVQNKKLLGE